MLAFTIGRQFELPAGLVRHYAADSLHLANAALVSSLPDLSSYAADLSASGADRPAFVHDRWNGKPAILFSGAQELASTALGGMPTDALTVFLVVAHFKRGTFPVFLSWGGGSTQGWEVNGNTTVDADGSPPQLIVKRGTWGNNAAVTTLRPGRGDVMMISGTVTGATTKIRIDGGTEVSDTGDAGVIDYSGGGTTTLKLGNKGANAAPAQMLFFEALIFGVALSDADRERVEAYLDAKYRITRSRANLVGLFNGTTDGVTYGIGASWGRGKKLRRHHSNPVITTGAGWKSNTVKDPHLLHDGTQYAAYYSGQNASGKYQIGRATAATVDATWADAGGNPLLALGSSGAFDDDGLSFAFVIKDDADADSTRRYKCWYTGLKASDSKQRIGYAYSSDGLSWTKHGQVLDVGTGGAFDDEAVLVGCVQKVGATWYLFYAGRQGTTNPRWQTGLATFSNPEGTYTKHGSNPVLQARFNVANSSQALTASAAAGTRTLTVTTTAAFNAGEPVILGGTFEMNTILSVDSGTGLTLAQPLANSHTTSSVVRSAAYNANLLRSLRQLPDGSWEGWATVFQPVTDLTPALRECVMRVTAAAIDGAWAFDFASGLLMGIEDTGRWDRFSAENVSLMRAA